MSHKITRAQETFVDDLLTDERLQCRASGHDQTVAEHYAALMSEGVEFPNILVWSEDGQAPYKIVEGHTRHAAYVIKDLSTVHVDVLHCSFADAVAVAAAANKEHGQPRTVRDRRRAVEMLLTVQPDLKNIEIAKHCGVHRETVSRVKQSLHEAASEGLRAEHGVEFDTMSKSDILPPLEGEGGADEVVEITLEGQVESVASQIDDIIKHIRAAKKMWDRLQTHEITTFIEAIGQNVKPAIESAAGALKVCKPVMVCPECEGDGCNICRDHGVVSDGLRKTKGWEKPA